MKTLSGQQISTIGIGSYGIGGRGHRTMEVTERVEDERYLDSLTFSLESGLNFTEISLGYGHGQAMRLFAKALAASSVQREDIFITNSLYPIDLDSLDIARADIESFYKIVETDYADSALVTQSMFAKFGKDSVYGMLEDLLSKNLTRYVSLSNASPDAIRDFYQHFGNKFIAHEGHLSFEVRALQDKGVFETCDELGITNIIWRPLRRNATAKHNWPFLTQLGNQYGKTQNQIILNWICHLGYHPMVMTANRGHMAENIESIGFEMTEQEYAELTNFRPPNYNPPKIDWEKDGDGDSIVVLVNDFDKHVR